MVVPQKNRDDGSKGLPPLIQHSLETLLEEPDNPLELGTAYDILWRYLRTQTKPKIEEGGIFGVFKPSLYGQSDLEIEVSELFKQYPSLKGLVDFLYEHFSFRLSQSSRLDSVTNCALSWAKHHYYHARKANSLAVLPRKRLAFMSLTQNLCYDSNLFQHYEYDKCLGELVGQFVGDLFVEHNHERLSKYHEKSRLKTFQKQNQILLQKMRESPEVAEDDLQWVESILKKIEDSQKEEEDDIVKRQRDFASTQRNPVLKAAGWTFAGVEEYVKENPDKEEGYLELHHQYMLRSELDLAFKVLKDAVKEHPEFLEARKVLAMDRYVWKGEWLKTINELEELREDLPDDPGVVIPLIHLYEELGMTQKTDELWKSFIKALSFGDAANSCEISKITGSRNSVHYMGNFELEVFGLPFNVVIKFFPDMSVERGASGPVVEYDMIETFRDIARKRPELGLLHSLPTVRYYSTEPPLPQPGVCLVTELVRGGWTLERGSGDVFKENVLPQTLKLLAAIHAASLEFPEGKLVDVIAEDGDYFEQRLRSILFDTYDFSPAPDESVVESFISSYRPISSVLKSLPRCYYKDANLKNWLIPLHDEPPVAIDFEKNQVLPPQLDLVSLLEFGREYLDDEGIDKMIRVYHTYFCEFSHQEIPLSDFMEAYPYAAVQRHLELTGYRKRDSALSQDEEELQRLENESDYHVNRALHYLSHLTEKHSGTERKNLLRLVELLPQILPSLTAG